MCPELIAGCVQELKSPDPNWEMVQTFKLFKPFFEIGFVAALVLLVVVSMIAVALWVWD